MSEENLNKNCACEEKCECGDNCQCDENCVCDCKGKCECGEKCECEGEKCEDKECCGGKCCGLKLDNTRIFLMALVGCLAVGLLFIGGLTYYRVHKKAANDKFTVAVATLMGLDALDVNGERDTYANYVVYVKAIGKSRDYDKTHNGPGAEMTDEQVSDQALFRMAEDLLVKSVAKEKGVKLEQKDVDELKKVLVAKYPTEADVEKDLQERYGWNLKEFEKNIIRSFALRQEVDNAIKNDGKMKETVKAQAQAVLDQIKAGADFAKMAAQYGQDGTASGGGDLGWFGKGDMVAPFENVAFSLKKGQLADELVETEYGFHIIQVTNKDARHKTQDPTTGKDVFKDMVQARHILFAFTGLDKELSKLASEAKIKILIPVHNPFSAATVGGAVTQ